MKSHSGGVVDVAYPTTYDIFGYGSRGGSNRAAGDSVLLSEIHLRGNVHRYLGRGVFPSVCAGLHLGPRHLSFMPDVDGQLNVGWPVGVVC
jgi:hypothetical protein